MADKHKDKKIAGLLFLAFLLLVAVAVTSWYTIKNWSTLTNAGSLSVLGLIGAILVELGLMVAAIIGSMTLSMKRD